MANVAGIKETGCPSTGRQSTFLWSVDSEMLDARSYLFGTIHVAYTEVWDYGKWGAWARKMRVNHGIHMRTKVRTYKSFEIVVKEIAIAHENCAEFLSRSPIVEIPACNTC